MNTAQPLRTAEAALLLGVTADALKNWRKKRQGPPFIRAGRRVVYRTQDLLHWQEVHRVDPETSSMLDP